MDWRGAEWNERQGQKLIKGELGQGAEQTDGKISQDLELAWGWGGMEKWLQGASLDKQADGSNNFFRWAREEDESGEQRRNDQEVKEAPASEATVYTDTSVVLYCILHSQCCVLFLKEGPQIA